jgi:hypothetical protein
MHCDLKRRATLTNFLYPGTSHIALLELSLLKGKLINFRKPQYNMALDIPLNLFHCTYEIEDTQKWIYDKEELRTVIAHMQNEWTIQNIK